MQKTTVNALVLAVCCFMLSAPTVLAQDFCQGDFNYNGSVAAEDVTIFLENFGRSPFNNPCPPDGPAPVAATGQTTCYDENGDPRNCITIVPPFNLVSTGEDGAWKKGVAWPNPRFTDNADGTVTDNLTGLIWLKDANCFGLRTWQEALDDCNGFSAGFCGLTDGSQAGDWRLPNHKELFSLTDAENYNPALPTGHPLTNVQFAGYWSSTTNVYETDLAWGVSMFNGGVSVLPKTFNYYVWPVRGGH